MTLITKNLRELERRYPVKPQDLVHVQDPVSGKDYYALKTDVVGGTVQYDTWRADITYQLTNRVTWGFKIWESLESDNLAHIPTEGSHWHEVSADKIIVEVAINQHVTLVDGSDVSWNLNSKIVSTALLDSNETAIDLTILGLVPGTHHSLILRKQQAGDLVITILNSGLPVFVAGEVAAGSSITLSGDAGKIFRLDFFRLDIPTGVALLGNTAGTKNTRILAIDSNNLLATMNRFIKKSTDGGVTWSTVLDAGAGITNIFNTISLAGVYGIAAGNNVIVKSGNSGTTWTNTGTLLDSIRAVLRIDANVAYVALQAGTLFRIYKTTDNCVTWTLINTPVQRPYSICKGSSNSVIYVGQTGGCVLKSTNSGAAWASVNIAGQDFLVKSIKFYSDLIGYAAGPGSPSSGHSTDAILFKTTNGGTSWTKLTITNDLGVIEDIGVIDANTIVVVGAGGIAHTVDGGATFNFTGVIQDVKGVTIVDASNIFVLTDAGAVYRYTMSTASDVLFVVDKSEGGGVSFTDQAANTHFSGPPSGADGAPAFRALVDADIPTLPKSRVGLPNVDNTSDANKPVSTAQAAADLAIATQLIDGATDNTLKKLQDKITAINAIIGGSSPDGDSIVNTVAELLAVFSTYPEGSDIATLLTGKVNTTDVYNALDQVLAGKTLDARQGKVLSDTIAALTTASVPDSTNKRYVTDAQLTVIGNTSGTNSGNETVSTVGTLINGATSKGTPVDADYIGLMDSAAGNVLKKLSWANLKATLLATWKDATGGLVGMTLFKINFKNTANTFTSFFTNVNTAARTYLFQDRDGTIADDTDLATKYSKLVPTSVKTAAYTAASNELVPTDTTSGNVPITLPVSPADGDLVEIKMVTQGGTNTTSVTCSGSQVFNKTGGATSLTLSMLAQAVLLQYKATGAIWYVLADDLSLSQLDLRYQALLNAKTDSLITYYTKTASYQLTATDLANFNAGQQLAFLMNVAAANNFTIPKDATVNFPIGFWAHIKQKGVGQPTVIPEDINITIRSKLGYTKISAQYCGVVIEKVAANEWYLEGDISA
jgi:hypothetical protein